MQLNKNITIKVKQAFEKKCFQLLIESYYTSLSEKQIQLDWNENDISTELVRIIRDNPIRLKWKISINREHYLPSKNKKTKGFSDKEFRIDLRLVTFEEHCEVEYFFEAKRLSQSSHDLKRRYINTGIDSFISDKYSNGSIIGYLINGKKDETIKDINSLLIQDKRYKETLSLKPHELINSYYESNHSEIGVLKHLIFEFTNITN